MAESESIEKFLSEKWVFVNCLDLYQGKNISKFLSKSIPGELLHKEEEEEEDKSVRSYEQDAQRQGTFKITGTLSNPEASCSPWEEQVLLCDDKEAIKAKLLECDVIIYNLESSDIVSDVEWAVNLIHDNMGEYSSQKIFVLISTVMTWATSKLVDPEDPELPFTEEDFRRRRPHRNFRKHCDLEKLVIKLGKTNKAKLITYVLAAGITYGNGEELLHYFFKAAWHNAPELPIFGAGENIVPMIHIDDLAAIVHNVVDLRPKTKYILAIDDALNNLGDIIMGISKSLGNGKCNNISEEEAVLLKDVSQLQVDILTVNLRMEAGVIKDKMFISWVAESGFLQNIAIVVRQYRQTLNLLPMKIVILGPPASGKSTVASQLSEYYKIHHIKILDVITENINALEWSAARAGDEDYEDDDKEAEADKELLDLINESKETIQGRIGDEYILGFMKKKLQSTPCQNQGYILDGFPKLTSQASGLFTADEMEEAEEDAVAKPKMPEVVICLEASDDFLKDRVMNLPEVVVNGTHNEEAGFLRRLDAYRKTNTDDETVLNFFDEHEIHPYRIDITEDFSPLMAKTMEKIKSMIGAPRNYGKTPEEKEEELRIEMEEKARKEEEERIEKERLEAEAKAEQLARETEWAARLSRVRYEEQQLLETQSLPVRNYLMNNIMPTLTKGLLECVKVRPDDPIDYLAEYLFKNNPASFWKQENEMPKKR